MRAFSYAWSLWSRDKDGSHTIRSAISENLMLHTNLMALCLIEVIRVIGVMADRRFTLRDYAFSTLFASVTLALT